LLSSRHAFSSEIASVATAGGAPDLAKRGLGKRPATERPAFSGPAASRAAKDGSPVATGSPVSGQQQLPWNTTSARSPVMISSARTSSWADCAAFQIERVIATPMPGE
jgi:hypothetical protein